MVIRNDSGHRLMVLLAIPHGSGWQENGQAVDSRLEWLYRHARVPPSHKPNCWGEYVSLPAGCSFGGGRLNPGNFANSNHNAPLVAQTLEDPSIQRIVRFVDSMSFFSCFSSPR